MATSPRRLQRCPPGTMMSWPRSGCRSCRLGSIPSPNAFYVSICHHGEPVGDDKIRSHVAVVPEVLRRTRYGHDPVTEIGRLVDFLTAQFHGATVPAPPLKFAPPAQHLFAGILMAADWMASGFAFDPGAVADRAADVLDRTAWNGWHSGAPAVDLLNGKEPRPAQAGVLALPLEERFAVIEAPTGTGKTEAALIWASRLVEADAVDGLYFAVPTRSAATDGVKHPRQSSDDLAFQRRVMRRHELADPIVKLRSEPRKFASVPPQPKSLPGSPESTGGSGADQICRNPNRELGH
jgi:hypothetical protein